MQDPLKHIWKCADNVIQQSNDDEPESSGDSVLNEISHPSESETATSSQCKYLHQFTSMTL